MIKYIIIVGILLFHVVSCSETKSLPKKDLGCEVPKENWETFITDSYSFSKPLNLKNDSQEIGDSKIWRFSNDNINVDIDVGRYSGLPKVYQSEKDYKELDVKVNGLKATVISFRIADSEKATFNKRSYAEAVFFPSDKNNLGGMAVWVTYSNEEDEVVACAIINSIRVK